MSLSRTVTLETLLNAGTLGSACIGGLLMGLVDGLLSRCGGFPWGSPSDFDYGN